MVPTETQGICHDTYLVVLSIEYQVESSHEGIAKDPVIEVTAYPLDEQQAAILLGIVLEIVLRKHLD